MEDDIILSVVLPCLNEENTIGVCIKKIKDVLDQEHIKGEIIVADNGSKDCSIEIARSYGVTIVSEEQAGYGAAYLCGLKEAKGKYIIIGDSDNTYDFSDIPVFLKKLQEGCDFAIGSRFKGKIHKNAMPWLNRYVGNPILSGMCRLFFNCRISDVHCGMRAFTLESYNKMKLRSLGMEFATEMVVSAIKNNLKICEVPIEYYLREGKSKLKPFSDAWRHIRFMLLYCPVWLYFIPGIIGFLSSMGLLLALMQGPFLFLGHYWDVHLMVFASVSCILSYQILNLGIYAHTFAVGEGFLKYDNVTALFQKYFTLEKGLLIGLVLFLIGLLINCLIFAEWFSKQFGPLYRIREAMLAMTLLVIGLQTIFSSFFINLLLLKRR